jgi:hypothetical protein
VLLERHPLDGRRRGGAARRLVEEYGVGLFDGYLSVPLSQPAGDGGDAHHPAKAKQRDVASALETWVSYFAYNVALCTCFF